MLIRTIFIAISNNQIINNIQFLDILISKLEQISPENVWMFTFTNSPNVLFITVSSIISYYNLKCSAFLRNKNFTHFNSKNQVEPSLLHISYNYKDGL